MAKYKNIFLAFIVMLTVAVSSGLFSGCSALPPYKACVDCTQFPLVYQGTIINYTQGVYIETACITIDLSKMYGDKDFKAGDIIYVEYVVKQGEFCSPDDNSTYRVYRTNKTESDNPYKQDMGTVNGSAIHMKEQSNASGSPIIPTVASSIMLVSLFNFGTGYTPITNSRVKVATWIAGLCVIAYIVASFFPDSGVVWDVEAPAKVMGIVGTLCSMLGLTGVRNLFDDWLDANKQGKQPELPEE